MKKIIVLLTALLSLNAYSGTVKMLAANNAVLTQVEMQTQKSITVNEEESFEEAKKRCAVDLAASLRDQIVSRAAKIEEDETFNVDDNFSFRNVVLYKSGENYLQLETRISADLEIDGFSPSVLCYFEDMNQEIGLDRVFQKAPFSVLRNRKFDGAIVSKIYQGN